MNHPPTDRDPHLQARNLVLRYGRNAASYQIVNPVIDIWLSNSYPAAAGYVDRRNTRVLAGEPVCPTNATSSVVEELKDSTQKSLCIFAAASESCPGFQGQAVRIGQQPVWNPADWSRKLQTNANLRQQLNRAANKGLTVEEWPTNKATNHPGLQKVVDIWLENRGLPPLHFLVEPQTLDFLEDRRTFVALINNEPVAFLNLCPIPERNGWLTEQFPRLPNAPNGAVESLMHQAAITLAQEKFDFLTMGMVPLTQNSLTEAKPIIRFLLSWIRAHGRRFYNFGGLYDFKNKFQPDGWEDLYLIADQGPVTLRHIIACSEAFTNSPLTTAVPRALYRAVRQELKWLAKR